MFGINDFYSSTDVTFNRETWDGKKSCILDYFRSQYADRLHTKYVRWFIAYKLLSCSTIVSVLQFNNRKIQEIYDEFHSISAH